jgi:hypothetical protein
LFSEYFSASRRKTLTSLTAFGTPCALRSEVAQTKRFLTGEWERRDRFTS